ncbi:MAG TPA: SHOCT domain-containing protein [Actinomycetes bacterium]|jgi:hypothetical protein|nr:SHOCT domain-containing protein [Actinomycetes bacterium]
MSLWDVLLSIFWFMLLVAWFWLLIGIITDLFRDPELSGGAKALWCLFLIVLPWIGVVTYLIVRGNSMTGRSIAQAQKNEQAFQQYVRDTAGASQPGVADELGKLADLRDAGKISASDYDQAKARVLGTGTVPTQSVGA